MENIQLVAIDDKKIVTMVTKKYAEDIEVVFCKETEEGTIFFGDMEIEYKYTANIDAALTALKEASLLQKLSTLQSIERFQKNASHFLLLQILKG